MQQAAVVAEEGSGVVAAGIESVSWSQRRRSQSRSQFCLPVSWSVCALALYPGARYLFRIRNDSEGFAPPAIPL